MRNEQRHVLSLLLLFLLVLIAIHHLAELPLTQNPRFEAGLSSWTLHTYAAAQVKATSAAAHSGSSGLDIILSPANLQGSLGYNNPSNVFDRIIAPSVNLQQSYSPSRDEMLEFWIKGVRPEAGVQVFWESAVSTNGSVQSSVLLQIWGHGISLFFANERCLRQGCYTNLDSHSADVAGSFLDTNWHRFAMVYNSSDETLETTYDGHTLISLGLSPGPMVGLSQLLFQIEGFGESYLGELQVTSLDTGQGGFIQGFFNPRTFVDWVTLGTLVAAVTGPAIMSLKRH